MDTNLIVNSCLTFIVSKTALVGSCLMIGAAIIMMLGLIQSGVRTNSHSCSCGTNTFNTVKVGKKEYLYCNGCGDLLTYKRGLPIVDIAKFFVAIVLGSLK